MWPVRRHTSHRALAAVGIPGRRGRAYPRAAAQVASHIRALSFPVATLQQALHRSSTPPSLCSASTPPTLDAVVDEVSPYVPTTFTSIQQISRQLPPELMERVCDPVCGGLRLLLARYSERFESKMIGQVHVVRSRQKQRQWAAPHHRLDAGDTARFPLAATSSPPVSATAAVAKPNSAAVQAILAELQELFPNYLVPVKALWATVPEAEEQLVRRCVLDALRSPQHRVWLTFYEHPAHCASCSTSAEAAAQTHVLEHGYVRCRLGAEAGDDVAAAPTPSSPNARMVEHQVQQYEWYRVARVLPTSAAELLFTGELQEQAALLLPPGRDVWHVLFSAPALFDVRLVTPVADESVRQPGAPAFSGADPSSAPLFVAHGATPPPSLCASVYVRFRLEERFVPPDMAGANEASIMRELETLAADRATNDCGLSSRQRRRKRKLQRQLAYLRNPTPYFDDRVLAQHLFDLLPLRDGVHQSALLGSLPQTAVQAFPPNVTELLQARKDLFQLSDVRHGILVQRADAPKVTQRSAESVTGEEILLYVFSAYSLRSDPREGTTISRCLPRLPRLVRERLFAMQDIVAEVLIPYPDKVEVLADRSPRISPHPSSTSPHTAGADERVLRELRTVRGRRDFLVPFRFVGEWQEKLTEKYVKQQEKDNLKTVRAHKSRASSYRGPPSH
ncbi:hypothetical protein LSCM1_01100 [Leishmania martiniquensis]|uniref:Uncharacterized protein n=1 Tax=Leishmania martiniquensis TaxID=1580590 RepID=A0A836GN71_9TRYP|nr:hypothetical protein LSCM1_01100 [Leishmania martiniquensis]